MSTTAYLALAILQPAAAEKRREITLLSNFAQESNMGTCLPMNGHKRVR